MKMIIKNYIIEIGHYIDLDVDIDTNIQIILCL